MPKGAFLGFLFDLFKQRESLIEFGLNLGAAVPPAAGFPWLIDLTIGIRLPSINPACWRSICTKACASSLPEGCGPAGL